MPEALPPRKILAHRIIWQGAAHAMSVAEFSADGRSVSISPFVREEAGTAFVNGTIEILADADGQLQVRSRK